MRSFLLLAALPLLATFAPHSMARPPEAPADPRVWAEPIPLRAESPGQRRLGRLRFLGGWRLSSNDPRFGGISAMQVEAGHVLALTDSARVFRFELPGKEANTKGAKLFTAELTRTPGREKKWRDSEAMAVHGDRVWITYERHNSIWRYALRDWRKQAVQRPMAMRGWPRNAGAEAMVRLRDGRFLGFAEARAHPDGSAEAVLFAGDPAEPGTRTAILAYRPPDGYRITDAAELSQGGLIFLNRKVSLLDGLSVKVTIASRPALHTGAVIEGQEIAHFGPPVATDNYEALSIVVEDGRTILWVASDDNYNAIQRTLLMKFALD
jgi:hypothetical protein